MASSFGEGPLMDAPTIPDLTVADLLEQFGPLPLNRIRLDPAPGTATEEDVVRIHLREDRLYELVDGVLVEKTMGLYESYLAALLLRLLGNFVDQHDLGFVLGADGMVRLAPGLVRIPDVSFMSWKRLGSKRVPRKPMANLAPDLAVEVLSPNNTAREMDRKLHDYFAAGTRLVWYVYPSDHTVKVFTKPGRGTVLREGEALQGGKVLPGFELPLKELFAEPGDSL